MENGYDELMGARPMARIIQEHIKKGLADEVLFGKLKGGGHVRVVVTEGERGSKLGFEFLDGPIKPKPEKLPAKPKRRSAPRPRPPGSRGDGNGKPPSGRGSVPKVPLVKV
jgi:ATP-dependent Clp protease ATP-binding subunit ClpA